MPQVTLLYGGLLGLLVLGLGINVTRLRRALGIRVEPGPLPKRLFVAVRAHGNAVEWTPLLLVLLLVVELAGGDARLLHVAGGTLLLGRVLHAVGFLTRLRTGVAGTGLTWLVALGLPGWALWLHFAR